MKKIFIIVSHSSGELDTLLPLLYELKQKYRKYALDTHPDKNNGNSRNFNIIKKAFKEIYDDLKLKENDKQFNELKNNSAQFIRQQESNSRGMAFKTSILIYRN